MGEGIYTDSRNWPNFYFGNQARYQVLSSKRDMNQTRRKLSGWPLGLLLALIILLVHLLRNILVPFALAAGGAYVLTPLIDFLNKRAALSRITAAVLIYFAVAGAVLGGGLESGGQCLYRGHAIFDRCLREHSPADRPVAWRRTVGRLWDSS